MNVLIIDDSPTMRRVVKGISQRVLPPDVNITEASDGSEAWDLISMGETDLVLSDWIMPSMSGLELIKKIRESEYLSDLPFIMVTTKGMRDDILEAIKAGVTDYCVKPIKPPVFENKIKLILEKYNLK